MRGLPVWPYSPLNMLYFCPFCPRFLSHSCHTEGQITSGAAVSVPAEVLNNKLASLNESQANLLVEVAKNAIKKLNSS